MAGPLISFPTLLVLAFGLEAAGYLVMPYLALHLRERFELSEANIGLTFLIGTWLRPLWALAASRLLRKFSSARMIQTGALVSGLSIAALALSHSSYLAVAGLVFANLGLAIWNPSIYAFVYDSFGSSDSTKKHVSQLNGTTYLGAAVGSAVASLLATAQRDWIFISAAASFLVVAVSASALAFSSLQKSKNSVSTYDDSESPTTESGPTWKKVRPELLVLGVASMAYWASYSQFNGFFSLFVVDWLKRPALVGVSFSFLTLAVAVLSLLISKLEVLRTRDMEIAVGSVAAVGLMWWLMTISHGLAVTVVFLAVLAISEAFFLLSMAHLWARQVPGNAHFMQSLNFALCNAGMGAGSLMAGIFYKSPTAENPGSASLLNFGLENLALCMGSAACLVYLAKRRSRNLGAPQGFHQKKIAHLETLGIDVYCFDRKGLQSDSRLAEFVTHHCDTVIKQVWNHKFSTSKNTLEKDLVLLAWDPKKGSAAGYFSASFLHDTNDTPVIYHSDGMILRPFRGKGLLSLFFREVNAAACKQLSLNRLTNIVATGYIHIFSMLDRTPGFTRIDWHPEQARDEAMEHMIAEDFADSKIDPRGVIKSGWCAQSNGMQDVWPSATADILGFPHDVNYFEGDVLVRLYTYDHEKIQPLEPRR